MKSMYNTRVDQELQHEMHTKKFFFPFPSQARRQEIWEDYKMRTNRKRLILRSEKKYLVNKNKTKILKLNEFNHFRKK